jgi:hypothetical protein
LGRVLRQIALTEAVLAILWLWVTGALFPYA